MNFLVFSVFFLIVYGLPPVSAIWFPLLLCPMLLGTLGIMWALASLGVFLRDISQIVGVLTTALLFLSPIFYPTSHIPEPFRPFYYVNPFASLLEMNRNALFAGEHPDWRILSILTFGSWVFAWCGYAWFMTTKKAFADVL